MNTNQPNKMTENEIKEMENVKNIDDLKTESGQTKTLENPYVIKTPHGQYTILIDYFLQSFENKPPKEKEKMLDLLDTYIRPRELITELISMDCHGKKQEFITDGNPEPYAYLKEKLNYPGDVIATCPHCNKKIKTDSLYLRYIRDLILEQLTRCAHCSFRHDCYTRLVTKMFDMCGLEKKKVPALFTRLIFKTLFKEKLLNITISNKKAKEKYIKNLNTKHSCDI